jgi:two-component system NtrC family sensor kinase
VILPNLMKIYKCLLLLLLPVWAIAQVSNMDSLKRVIAHSSSATNKISALRKLSDYYIVASNGDSALYYAELLKSVSIKANNKAGEGYAIGNIAECLRAKGKSAQALSLSFKALQIFKDIKDSADMANECIALASLYNGQGNKLAALQYSKNAWQISNKIKDYDNMYLSASHLRNLFLRDRKFDSAMFYSQQELRIQKENPLNANMPRAASLGGLSSIYFYLNKPEKANAAMKEAFLLAKKQNSPVLLSVEIGYADLLSKLHKPDSALTYVADASNRIKNRHELTIDLSIDRVLANIYKEKKQFDLAYKYQSEAILLKDSLYNTAQAQQFANLSFNEQQHETDLKNAQIAYQARLKFYGVIAALALVLIIAIILWNNNRKQQKANQLLESQKQQIQDTLHDLKITQTQLIQSEKMASLGELTAGIAHEIQNPLNFVNNFSDVNREMLEELKAESKKPKAERDEQLEIGLINDLIDNEKKINHHGKRADSIVKGMLEHSRNASGQKEPTDINALADEYLRLSYHGLRAKDKSFNAELVTHFDATLPKVNAIPQDMGRVLLNLFNNAFYAVNQKSKTVGTDYKPEVSVTTIVENGQVVIKVKDNGIGIPDAIKEKIMQPFFTTKPTGEGTGLGLSLTYDMVVKGHGGSIQVKGKEGEGSEFIISLQIS